MFFHVHFFSARNFYFHALVMICLTFLGILGLTHFVFILFFCMQFFCYICEGNLLFSIRSTLSRFDVRFSYRRYTILAT
uniref:Uncharacterized protein n=1 Tax=Arundo donax TaxID=35708 RepID=A0A0A9ERM4_ARUDO